MFNIKQHLYFLQLIFVKTHFKYKILDYFQGAFLSLKNSFVKVKIHNIYIKCFRMTRMEKVASHTCVYETFLELRGDWMACHSSALLFSPCWQGSQNLIAWLPMLSDNLLSIRQIKLKAYGKIYQKWTK